MGFLRKATFVATGGASGLVIKANSKKERTAKALEAQVRLQKQALKQQRQLAAEPASRPTGPTFSNMPRISFRLTDYDGGLPLYPRATEVGELTLTNDRTWELRLSGSNQFFYGDLDRYSMTAAKLRSNSCRVTMTDKQNPAIKWRFDLPRTSATALAVEVAGRLAMAAPPKPSSGTQDATVVPSLPQALPKAPRHAAPGSEIEVAAPQIGIADEIAKLGQLRESGLLTEEEFSAQKAKLLGTS